MTKTVFSVTEARLFSGSDAGAAICMRSATVVAVVELRLTFEASASVPVFTDQRSTPHCAHARLQSISTIRETNNKQDSGFMMLSSYARFQALYLLSALRA